MTITITHDRTIIVVTGYICIYLQLFIMILSLLCHPSLFFLTFQSKQTKVLTVDFIMILIPLSQKAKLFMIIIMIYNSWNIFFYTFDRGKSYQELIKKLIVLLGYICLQFLMFFGFFFFLFFFFLFFFFVVVFFFVDRAVLVSEHNLY